MLATILMYMFSYPCTHNFCKHIHVSPMYTIYFFGITSTKGIKCRHILWLIVFEHVRLLWVKMICVCTLYYSFNSCCKDNTSQKLVIFIYELLKTASKNRLICGTKLPIYAIKYPMWIDGLVAWILMQCPLHDH